MTDELDERRLMAKGAPANCRDDSSSSESYEPGVGNWPYRTEAQKNRTLPRIVHSDACNANTTRNHADCTCGALSARECAAISSVDAETKGIDSPAKLEIEAGRCIKGVAHRFDKVFRDVVVNGKQRGTHIVCSVCGEPSEIAHTAVEATECSQDERGEVSRYIALTMTELRFLHPAACDSDIKVVKGDDGSIGLLKSGRLVPVHTFSTREIRLLAAQLVRFAEDMERDGRPSYEPVPDIAIKQGVRGDL